MGQSMHGQTNKAIRKRRTANRLRSNMTDAEQKLWRALRRRQMNGFKFRRQHPFLDFVLDFVSVEARLVVEVDGGQHASSEKEDKARTGKLEAAGYRVLRFWNHDVLKETDAVCDVIFGALVGGPHPHPVPPLEREGTPQTGGSEK